MDRTLCSYSFVITHITLRKCVERFECIDNIGKNEIELPVANYFCKLIKSNELNQFGIHRYLQNWLHPIHLLDTQ